MNPSPLTRRRHLQCWTAAALAAGLGAASRDASALSEADAAAGIRAALERGALAAVGLLGRDNGFLGNEKVRIPLPEQLQELAKVMKAFGQQRRVDELVTAMNRAAEQAVPKAQELLVKAVREMSVTDAKNILTGGDDAATRYFKGKTQAELTTMFLPTVKQTTDKLALAKKYDKLAGKASKFGLVKDEDAKIEGYVTRKALDGLYAMIAEEEKAIRKNPVGAAGSLAKKVFGAL